MYNYYINIIRSTFIAEYCMNIPTEIKILLKEMAIARHGKIYTLGTVSCEDECYTIVKNWYIYWYDDEFGSTHLVKIAIS